MDLAAARYLTSPTGLSALAALPPTLGSLSPNALVAELRRDHGPNEASALATQVTLRAAAFGRWGELPVPLLTREGLEMMTHPVLSRRRAERLRTLGFPVVDLTCGLGGDAHAIISAGVPLLGVERDAVTAALASHNLGGCVVIGDALSPPADMSRAAVFIDPSRRSGNLRRFDPSAFSPPLDAVFAMAAGARAGIVKAPPGLDHTVVPRDGEMEFVQLGRSLREAAIWFGAGADPGLRRAVMLPAGVEIDSRAPEAAGECVEPGAFLIDPESCVTRAGLVRHLAAAMSARMVDPQLAYLSSDTPSAHAMAATFEILDGLPFSLARLRDLLRARRWRPDEIRRRAFPIEPDELRRLLGRMDGDPVTLICTTIAGRRTVFVARRIDRNGEDL
ncbi:MAG: THUMP-like domain-containing protein [Tepidiformaceae bacterium]